VKTVVFDKTGTITRGYPMVTTIIQLVDNTIFYLEKVMAIVGSAESNSEHPIATAITRFVKEALSTDLVATCTDFHVLDLVLHFDFLIFFFLSISNKKICNLVFVYCRRFLDADYDAKSRIWRRSSVHFLVLL